MSQQKARCSVCRSDWPAPKDYVLEWKPRLLCGVCAKRVGAILASEMPKRRAKPAGEPEQTERAERPSWFREEIHGLTGLNNRQELRMAGLINQRRPGNYLASTRKALQARLRERDLERHATSTHKLL